MKRNLSLSNDSEKSWLVRGAAFDKGDIPFISTAKDIPTSVISFNRSRYAVDVTSWVHFYEADGNYSCLWNRTRRYVDQLRRFGGIISPDYSICPDYPLPIQQYNKYRNQALAYWLSTQGIPVIPNVRWGDEHSYDFCFKGIEKNSIVAVGTHGQMRKTANRELFKRGLPVMISTLSPRTILVYGTVPDDVFNICKAAGIKIVRFPSETERYHNHVKEVA